MERATEIFSGAVLALIIFGPSGVLPGATLLDELRVNLLAVGFFYMASGYAVSCVAMGLLSPRRSPLLHGIIMAIFFVANALVFFLFVGGGGELPLVAIIVGAAIVLVINAVGTIVLKAGDNNAPNSQFDTLEQNHKDRKPN